jgi:hypothetical protein
MCTVTVLLVTGCAGNLYLNTPQGLCLSPKTSSTWRTHSILGRWPVCIHHNTFGWGLHGEGGEEELVGGSVSWAMINKEPQPCNAVMPCHSCSEDCASAARITRS